jgi:hypothetical protein
MTARLTRRQFTLACAALPLRALAQAPAMQPAGTAVPPILFKPAVDQATLPATPEDWVDTPQIAEVSRGHTFSKPSSGQKGEFQTTLTARLLWQPQVVPGDERIKKLNTFLHSSREIRAGKFVMTTRYRIAAPTRTQSSCCGKPATWRAP